MALDTRHGHRLLTPIYTPTPPHPSCPNLWRKNGTVLIQNTKAGAKALLYLEHTDNSLRHLVVFPPWRQAIESCRCRHTRCSTHVSPRPTRALFVYEMNHGLEWMIALRNARVRGQLIAQPLHFELYRKFTNWVCMECGQDEGCRKSVEKIRITILRHRIYPELR